MRTVRGVFLVLALLAAALLILPPAAAQRLKRPRTRPEIQGMVYLYQVERGVYKLTNNVRRQKALPPLTQERVLSEVARKHCQDMLARQYFSHNNPDGKSPHERIIGDYPYPLLATGENIWGADGSEPLETEFLARIIVDTWMSSPGHRRNILNPDFTDIGVGVAALGKQIRATQVFAKIKPSP
jgi:uncharacterized protein YkwD